MYCSFTEMAAQHGAQALFGGRRVFEFPVSKTASLIPSSEQAVRKQPARYRAKLYLLTTIRRLLRTKIAWPENWGIINANCKFASTESLSRHFVKNWAAGLGCHNCHGGGTQAQAVTIVSSLSSAVFRSRRTPLGYLQQEVDEHLPT